MRRLSLFAFMSSFCMAFCIHAAYAQDEVNHAKAELRHAEVDEVLTFIETADGKKADDKAAWNALINKIALNQEGPWLTSILIDAGFDCGRSGKNHRWGPTQKVSYMCSILRDSNGDFTTSLVQPFYVPPTRFEVGMQVDRDYAIEKINTLLDLYSVLP